MTPAEAELTGGNLSVKSRAGDPTEGVYVAEEEYLRYALYVTQGATDF